MKIGNCESNSLTNDSFALQVEQYVISKYFCKINKASIDIIKFEKKKIVIKLNINTVWTFYLFFTAQIETPATIAC